MVTRTRVQRGTIEEKRREPLLDRLRRAEGQVRGIQRMVEEGRYCVDILQQLAAVNEALRGAAKDVFRNYLENCATHALRSGKPDDAQRVYDEISENFLKFAR